MLQRFCYCIHHQATQITVTAWPSVSWRWRHQNVLKRRNLYQSSHLRRQQTTSPQPCYSQITHRAQSTRSGSDEEQTWLYRNVGWHKRQQKKNKQEIMTLGKHGNDKETKGRFHPRNRRRQKGQCLLGITESKKEIKIIGNRLRRKEL